MVTHGTVLTAVHGQPGSEAVTATLPVPPEDGKFWLVGAIEKMHGVSFSVRFHITDAPPP